MQQEETMKSRMARFADAAIIVLLALSMLTPAVKAAPHDFSCADVTEIPQVECQALVALYNDTGGSSWINHSNWLITNTPSTWYGVTVESGYVLEINLSNNNLSGSIPVELGNLGNLVYLYLSHNQLVGQIPLELRTIGNQVRDVGTNYYRVNVDLSYNQLNGRVLPELFTINLLGGLSLDHNRLSGSIPSTLPTYSYLEWLFLDDNQLSGPIPPELGNLATLWGIDLSHNHLSGSIPSQLGSICTRPTHGDGDNCTLFLDHNALSGDVPPELANLHSYLSINPDQVVRLDYNLLNVPDPYPSNPPTDLQKYLIANDPGWEKTQRVISTDIPVDGAQVQPADGRVTLLIPPGGVSQPVTLKFTTNFYPSAPTSGLTFGHIGFTLAVYDQGGNLLNPFSFDQPVTITIHYLDSDVAVLQEDQITLYDWDTAASTWVDAAQTCSPASAYTRDPANNTLSVQICHLSEFALLGSALHNIMLPLVDKP